MSQPEGFVSPGNEDLVCRLHKSLYGLKQSPRCWNQKIDEFLKSIGFIQTHADHSIYIQRTATSVLYLALYVDDLLLFSNQLEAIDEVKKQLGARFDMSDLGPATFVLGIQVTRDRPNRTIVLDQSKYVAEVLERSSMTDAKPASTPLDPGIRLVALADGSDDKPHSHVQQYQSAVGSLMYAMTATRPDIAAAVSKVSKFMANPSQSHWVAVKHILRYLNGTSHYGLVFSGANSAVKLVGYSDADWGGDLDTRRSTTGYVFQLGGGSISWASRQQPTVALSTVEAEYMALSDATKEAVWLRALLLELGYGQDSATIIHEDNQGCLSLAKNPVHHNRTKHIDIRYHFIRSHIAGDEIKPTYCTTEDMVADILTKPLDKTKHLGFTDSLGVRPTPLGSRGSVENDAPSVEKPGLFVHCHEVER
jgi:hypothetical protein